MIRFFRVFWSFCFVIYVVIYFAIGLAWYSWIALLFLCFAMYDVWFIRKVE